MKTHFVYSIAGNNESLSIYDVESEKEFNADLEINSNTLTITPNKIADIEKIIEFLKDKKIDNPRLDHGCFVSLVISLQDFITLYPNSLSVQKYEQHKSESMIEAKAANRNHASVAAGGLSIWALDKSVEDDQPGAGPEYGAGDAPDNDDIQPGLPEFEARRIAGKT